MSDNEKTIHHMRMDQMILGALTIVGRAETINRGRVELTEYILTLNDEECAHLIWGLAEMMCMKLMAECPTKEEWFSALEKTGELIAIAIAGLEAEGQ